MTDPLPRLVPSAGGLNILYQEKYLYHELKPETHAIQHATGANIPEQTLVLIPSPLLGYGLTEILHKLPHSSHILCLEKEEKLMRFTLEYVPGVLLKDPRITFIRTDSVVSLLNYLQTKLNLRRFRRVILLTLNRGYFMHRTFYDHVYTTILKQLQTLLRNRMTAIQLGRRWMKNLFWNSIFLPKALPLTDLRIGKPPLVIGAGESLEENLSLVKELRKNLYLIAVDTALPVLSASGLVPDLVVSVDAQATNLQDFIGFSFCDIPLAADLTVFPGILRRWTGPLYLFLSEFESLQWFSDSLTCSILPPRIPPLGSVGTLALYIASKFTSKDLPIFCTGIDFYYRPGKPHARGAYSQQFILSRQGRISNPLWIEDCYKKAKVADCLATGEKVSVDTILVTYKDLARDICEKDPRIYSIGKKGLAFGASPLSGIEELTRLISQVNYNLIEYMREKDLAQEVPLLSRASWNRDTVIQFLSQNRSLLESFYRKAKSILKDPSSIDSRIVDIQEDIEKIDYILLDFPDSLSEKTAYSFLARAAASAWDYVQYLEKILSCINSPLF